MLKKYGLYLALILLIIVMIMDIKVNTPFTDFSKTWIAKPMKKEEGLTHYLDVAPNQKLYVEVLDSSLNIFSSPNQIVLETLSASDFENKIQINNDPNTHQITIKDGCSVNLYLPTNKEIEVISYNSNVSTHKVFLSKLDLHNSSATLLGINNQLEIFGDRSNIVVTNSSALKITAQNCLINLDQNKNISLDLASSTINAKEISSFDGLSINSNLYLADVSFLSLNAKNGILYLEKIQKELDLDLTDIQGYLDLYSPRINKSKLTSNNCKLTIRLPENSNNMLMIETEDTEINTNFDSNNRMTPTTLNEQIRYVIKSQGGKIDLYRSL
jgi:hypothetical protein